MKKLASYFIAVLLLSVFALNTQAQQSTYDPHKAFAPRFEADGGSPYRAADGTPGPQYWQNQADYDIEATLDTADVRLSGNVTITYTNNSPNELKQLWLQLTQNYAKGNSKSVNVYGHPDSPAGEKGFKLNKVRVKVNGSWETADYKVFGTRMQIRLSEKLKAKGASAKIAIDYSYLLPKNGRGAYMDAPNGPIYQVSYWYPRMSVYDDIRGWNTLPFLGAGEFYLDYGTIDYKVTLPEGILMAGSGTLMNPKETLTEKQRRRLGKARNSDKKVMIRSKDELDQPATAQGKDGMLTWHYRMKNTRDVAWGASEGYIWDAAKASYKSGNSTLAMSFYPEGSLGDNGWGRATNYLKRSLETFSNRWFEYPYPNAVNVAGATGGMEYPGLTFDSWKAKGYLLFLLITHEMGHNWYPMVVGSNERRHAWMDEGFNTFIDTYVHKDFNDGEYAPKRDSEYAPGGGKPSDEVISVINNDNALPVMSRADAIKGDYYHPLEYFKAAHGLVLLREVILGHERFDYAFRKYTRDWAYKHPTPKDFFRAMNNNSGENLDWFWKGWFINNWKLDQAVTGVSYTDGDPDKGAKITLKNMKQMVMPVLMTVTLSDGSSQEYKLPAEVWMHGATYTMNLSSEKKVKKVELDTGHQLPDENRDNNVWSAQ